MRPRLLALLTLLLLIQTSLARQSQTAPGDVPETCLVTNASDHPVHTSMAVYPRYRIQVDRGLAAIDFG